MELQEKLQNRRIRSWLLIPITIITIICWLLAIILHSEPFLIAYLVCCGIFIGILTIIFISDIKEINNKFK